MRSTTMTSMIVIIFLISGCKAKSQQDGDMIRFAEECRTSFLKENYSLQRKIEIGAKQLEGNPLVMRFKNTGLSNATMLVFTSTKTVQDKIKPGFKVLIYQYKLPSEAASKFKEIEKVRETQGESILGKDWDHVFLQGAYIIRLDGGCIYSKDTWKKLKEDFLRIRAKIFNDPAGGAIDCECGGNCY